MQDYKEENMFYHDTIGEKALRNFIQDSSNLSFESRLISSYKKAGSALFSSIDEKDMNKLIDLLSENKKIYYSSRTPKKGDLALDIDKEVLNKFIRLRIIGIIQKINGPELIVVGLDKKKKIDYKNISNWHACAYIDI